MHTQVQRTLLGITGIFVSIFLLFSGFTISASRVSPVTFGPPVAHAGGAFIQAVLVAVVIVVAVYTGYVDPSLFGVTETFEGSGVFTGMAGVETETAVAAVAIDQAASTVIECAAGLICGSDGNSTYSTAPDTSVTTQTPDNGCPGGDCSLLPPDDPRFSDAALNPGSGGSSGGGGSDSSYDPGPVGPSVSLTVDGAGSSVIDAGQSAILSWSSSGSYCEEVSPESVRLDPSGSMSTGPLTQTTSYQIHCADGNGFGGTSAVTVTVLHPKVAISADPLRVRAGGASTVSWNGTDIKSCTVTGPSGTLASGKADASYVFSTNSPVSATINTQSVFTITCQTHSEPISKSVMVNVVPTYQEF